MRLLQRITGITFSIEKKREITNFFKIGLIRFKHENLTNQ